MTVTSMQMKYQNKSLAFRCFTRPKGEAIGGYRSCLRRMIFQQRGMARNRSAIAQKRMACELLVLVSNDNFCFLSH